MDAKRLDANVTTVTAFQPSSTAPFQFQPTLDGDVYNVVVTWNLFGARYYVSIYQLDGALVVTLPLIGSASGVNVSSLAWSGGVVTATTEAPHGYAVASVVALTVAGCAPDAYNGQFDCVVTGPSTLTYQLADDPGSFTQLGTIAYDISLVDGYFDTTMVFREASQSFEVSP